MGPGTIALMSGLGAGALGLGGTILTNNALRKEASKNRKYQTAMTYAKYPIAVAGMKKADINPDSILTQGAQISTPNGSQAMGLQNPTTNLINTLSGVAQLYQQQANIQQTHATTRKTNAETHKIKQGDSRRNIFDKGFEWINKKGDQINNWLNKHSEVWRHYVK